MAFVSEKRTIRVHFKLNRDVYPYLPKRGLDSSGNCLTIITILPDNFDFSRVNSILSDYKNNSAVYNFSRKAVSPESIQKFIAENLNDLHRLLKNSKRAGKTTKQSEMSKGK